MEARLVVFGAGGHAKVVIEAIRGASPGLQITVVDDNPAGGAASLLGLRAAGRRDWLANNWPGAAVAPAIGNNQARAAIADWLASQGRALATVLHPSAILSPTAGLGAGSFIAAGAVINAEARIAEAVIINTMASIDHDCEIGAFAHIAPGSRLCGGVRVGARTLIGAGSVLIPGVSVGADAVVGAGSVVLRDVPPGAKVAGSPARLI